ncbi:GNAT family N-acetyltransferase [Actinoplanes sp. LDG1-06]|uniref:GNAT family N-acetyltransferase n=1 Tax=Paractinoplanes ovalisporus TaxID=2810368 RepID=A0ABS2AQ39_9ACTN|nr:GNAT family N-acetyltransferase [Actinoplanes ovalisporus]MBM2621956.1 GNAT family N-acetyltransferase [Actinoplanes ovalisporus]
MDAVVDASVYAAYEPEPAGERGPSAAFAVREAVPDDIPGCLDLVESVLKLDREPWRKKLSESTMLHVAEEAGRIVGYARATFWTPPDDAPANAAPSGWYLMGLVVAPEQRRRGVGRALTRVRLEAIAERASEVWYFASARNQSSIDLHTRLGFVEVTRDFWFPGLTFEGGVGVLARCTFEA